MKIAKLACVATLTLLTATPALAHSGHMEHGLTDGLLHPLTGLDHLAMLLTTGLLAGVTRRSLLMPLLALLALVLGTGFGFALGAYSWVEPAILISLVAASSLLLSHSRLTALTWAMPLFALFHGWAHGVEAPATQLLGFTLGSVLMAGVLLFAGFALGRKLQAHPRLQQGWAGGVLVLTASLLG